MIEQNNFSNYLIWGKIINIPFAFLHITENFVFIGIFKKPQILYKNKKKQYYWKSCSPRAAFLV